MQRFEFQDFDSAVADVLFDFVARTSATAGPRALGFGRRTRFGGTIQRGDDLALGREPVFVRLAVCLAVRVPDLVRALPDAVFQRVFHLIPPYVDDAISQCQDAVNQK